MRAPILLWIIIVYLFVTLAPLAYNLWVAWATFASFDPVLEPLLLAEVVLKTGAIVLLLLRKEFAVHAIAGLLVIAGLEILWFLYVAPGVFIDDIMAFFWLPGVAITIGIFLYTRRLKKIGVLRPWRDLGPAVAFD